jgi:hypothetical protein
MDPSEVRRKLEEAKSSGDFIAETKALTEELDGDPQALPAIDAILLFMEGNPQMDFGTPGPLVHFAERFYGRGYDAKLIQSIQRRPTSITAWMLNRIINGTRQQEEPERLISILGGIVESPSADPQTRQLAKHFLDRNTNSS